jgi:arylsulfatase A
MRSRPFILLGLFVAQFASTTLRAADVPAKPNVVLIFIDDLGIGDIGPFGNKTHKTPHLDRLASEGMKFQSFYATPVCSMSRAQLMTGCYNARVSIPGVLFPGSKIGINPDETIVPEVLKQQGYATKCIGKWHLGHREPFLPTRHGFDSYFGIPYSNDMTIDPEHAVFAKDCLFREGLNAETSRKEALRNKVPLMRGDEVIEYPVDQATLTKRYTAEAVAFLKAHQDQPFFLYLPHSMVHVPLAATDEFLQRNDNNLFAAAVEEMDWSVGQIMQTLKELKLDERTLVIFTSDNGAATGSSLPYRGKKGTTYEGGVREPCIMRWTGKIAAGSECTQMAGNIDVLPTLAKLAGAPIGSDHKLNGRMIDGRDISSLLFDSKAGPVRDTHLYFSGERLSAIRKGPWKLFVAAASNNPGKNKQAGKKAEKKKDTPVGPELYNLSDDPYEAKNLASEKPDLVNELREEAKRLEAEIQANKRPAGSV